MLLRQLPRQTEAWEEPGRAEGGDLCDPRGLEGEHDDGLRPESGRLLVPEVARYRWLGVGGGGTPSATASSRRRSWTWSRHEMTHRRSNVASDDTATESLARRGASYVTTCEHMRAHSPVLQGFWATGRQSDCCPTAARNRALSAYQDNRRCRFAGSSRDGSDGTRTRDLRRDRLVPRIRRLATIDALSLYSCGSASSRRWFVHDCVGSIS
jgi:hypothetical protein